MQKYKKILLSLAIVAVPVISWAVIGNNKDTKVNSNNPNNAGNTSNSTISKQTQENITKVMTENLGAKGTVNVNPSPVNGIVEVEVGGQIVYATPDGRYILVGSILDTKNKINLTQEKMDKKQAVRWSDLPLSDALFMQKGKFSQKRQIAIFADANCGFCKKMEQELQKVDNLAVHTFLIPMLSEDSLTKAVNIWCQPKNTQVWQDWMLNHKTPPQAMSNCKNPIQANAELARKIGVTGTPAIIFVDGTRVNGLMPAAELTAKLNSLDKK